MQSARRLAPVVDALQMEGLAFKLTHLGAGKYDIDDILARLNTPPEKPVDPNAPPPGFALFNLALKDASLDFTDKTVGRTHQLRALTLAVPFLSNLDTLREVKTEPRLAFSFNGSAFDSAAASTPFTVDRKTDATLKLARFDLTPYLGYLPNNLPVRLTAGVLDADLTLAFEQTPRAAVKLKGTAQLSAVTLQDTTKQDLLGFEVLKLVLSDVRPLEQNVKLASLELNAPMLQVKRDSAGRLNLVPGGPAPVPDRPTAKPSAETETAKWQVEVAKISLTGGQVNLTDETTQPVAKLALRNLKLAADSLGWPFSKPLQFSGSAELGPNGQGASGAPSLRVSKAASLPAKPAGNSATPPATQPATSPTTTLNTASLTFDGQATDQAAHVNASIGNLSLALAAPYLAQFLEPQLAGNLASDLILDWTPLDLKVVAKTVSLSNLALLGRSGALELATQATPAVKLAAGGKVSGSTKKAATQVPTNALASLKKLELRDTQLDLGQQTLVIGKVTASQPATSIERDASQSWMFERWLKTGGPAPKGTSVNATDKTERRVKPAANLAAAKAIPATKATTTVAAAPAAKPWSVSVKDIQVEGGAFKFVDRAMQKPVALDISAVKVNLKNYVLDGKKPFPLALSFKLKQPQGEAGQVDYNGDLGLAPLSAQGNLTALQIPVHAFEPYFAGALNVELLRAEVGFKGEVKFSSGANGPSVKVKGDSVVEEFRAHTVAGAAVIAPAVADTAAANAATGTVAGTAAKPAEAGGLKISEELLTWKALGLRGLDIALSPGVATAVSVSETALTDFFARVLIDPSGRFNLQDLVKSSSSQTPTAPALVTSPAAASAQGATALAASAPAATSTQSENAINIVANNIDSLTASTLNSSKKIETDPARPAPAAAQASGPEAIINIGPISLVNGKVFFSDQFIRPNYSANLSELNGRLSAFSSVPRQGTATAGVATAPAGSAASAPTGAEPAATVANAPVVPAANTAVVQMADLELRGRAEGTASLEILGKLNPLARPLALDIKAKVRDLELPPLSPYSVKYAGHGIERGKLSVDVAYVVLPNGQLDAKNKIILNQLKFGDKVEGAPASLPVRLAVALLADRNGVIDLDLPVSGSLNDPQFRLAPIIFKIIGNLIVKAITAPFALLAWAFGGGGDELSQVAFAPGSAALASDAQANLDKVAKALLERPALKMTVVGLSNLEEEREAFKRERLKALLQAEKRRAQVVASGSARAAAAAAETTASAASAASAATASGAPTTVLSEAETPVLIKEVYRRSDFPKPRNIVGIAKELPVDEMQALLLANIVVTQDAMQELALQRGVAVKDYLTSKQLPVERLFLGSAKSGGADLAGAAPLAGASEGKSSHGPGSAAGNSAGSTAGGTGVKWTPRAELNLATN